MAQFDSDNYFANKLGSLSTADKVADLSRASDAKILALKSFHDQAVAHDAQLYANSVAEDNSVVGKLGLNPDGLLGGAVNMGMSILDGAVTIEKNIAAGIHDSRLGFLAATTPEEPLAAKQAFANYRAGKATPSDLELLNSDPQGGLRKGLLDNPRPYMETLTNKQNAIDSGAQVRGAMDSSGLVHRQAQNALTNSLGDGYDANANQVESGWNALKNGNVLSGAGDVASGLAGALVNIGAAAAKHPQGATEFLANNLPQLVLASGGAAGMAITNIPYAVSAFGDGIAAYQKANKGRIPSNDEMAVMAGKAATLAAAETIGDKITLGAGRLGKATAEAADAASKASLFKKALYGATHNGPVRTVGATLEGAAGEFATEAYQTAVENDIKGEVVTAKDAYVGGAIGAMVGGMTSGSLHGATEMANATPEKVASQAKKTKQSADDTAVFQSAAKENDPSVYLNQDDPAAYNPSKAIGVLLQHAKQADTDPKVKEANLKQADKILADIEDNHAEAQASVDYHSPEAIQEAKARISHVQGIINATDPADTVKLGALNEIMTKQTEDLALRNDTQEGMKAMDAYTVAAQQLEDGRKLMDVMVNVAEPATKITDLQTITTLADTVPDQADIKAVESVKQAVSSLINLSMRAPDSLDDATAAKLANNKNNTLTTEQRDYLRAFSESRKAENALATITTVNNDILNGKGKNEGIVSWRAQLTRAIASGNKKSADRVLTNLTAFAEGHTAKAKAFVQASKQGLGTQIQNVNGQWIVATPEQNVDEETLKAGGGLAITQKSGKLLKTMPLEAQALKAAVRQMSLAHALRFGEKTTVPAEPAVQSESPTQAISPISSISLREMRERERRVGSDKSLTPTSPGVSSVEKATPTPSAASTSPVPNKTREAELARRKEIRDRLLNPTNPTPAKEVERAAVQQPAERAQRDEAIVAESATANTSVGKENSTTPSLSIPASSASSTPASATELPPVAALPAANSPPASSLDASSADNPSISEPTGLDVEGAAATVETNTSVPSGVLNILGLKQEITGDIFQDYINTNLVARFFSQDKANPLYASQRPLASMKNFLSTWKEASDTRAFLKDYLVDASKLIDEQVDALNAMRSTLLAWVPKFKANLTPYTGRQEFMPSDMMQYLMEQTPEGMDVEENIKTAMAASMYHWILAKANSPAYLTPSQVNTMHGMEGENIIDPDGYATLKRYAGFEYMTINELGSLALQALGLRPSKDTPQDLQPRLVTALGTHVMTLLEQQGFLIRTHQKNSTIAEWLGVEGEVPPGSKDFIQVVRQNDGKLTDEMSRIQQDNTGTGSITEKLFGVERAPTMASTEPVKFTQQKAKGTNQDVPKLLVDTLSKIGGIPHTAIPEMDQLFGFMGAQSVLKVAGVVELDPERIHVVNLGSVEAQNRNLENQWDMMQAMRDDPTNPDSRDQAFYVHPEVWRNYRGGFADRSLNLQTSKIHRYAFTRPGWESIIDLDNRAMVDEFLIAVAMNLGVKTDQQDNDSTLSNEGAFKKKLRENPDIMKAVRLIQNTVLSESENAPTKWTSEESELIERVAIKGEGMASLQALVAFAQYTKAKDAGIKSITIHLLVGVDGKTNGPMLSHLALGAAEDLDGFFTLLNRGGFYSTDEGQATHYSDWYGRGDSRDLYEDLGNDMITDAKKSIATEAELKILAEQAKIAAKNGDKSAWANYYKRFTPEVYAAFEAVTGKLMKDAEKVSSDGRNLVKTPLTSFMFGSGLGKSVTAMQDKFIEAHYANLEKFASGERKDITLQQYLEEVNRLIDRGNSKDRKANPIDANIRMDDALKLKLNAKQEASLRSAFDTVIGKQAKMTMNQKFSVYITRRNALNQTVNAGFMIHEAAYETMRAKAIQEGITKGTVAKRIDQNGKIVPLHSLTIKQDSELRTSLKDLAPVMHTAYSQEEGNLNAGMYLAKTDKGTTDDPLFKSNVKISGKSVSTHAVVTKEAAPGVIGSSYPIHSSDSFIMHKQLGDALNIHDEKATGLSSIVDAAQNINQTTVEAFLHYSPVREAHAMFERQVVGMVKAMQKGTLDKRAAVRLFESWDILVNKNAPDELRVPMEDLGSVLMTASLNNALDADTLRLGAIAKMGSVDQYTLQGGQFEVTQAIRDEATKMLTELSDKPSMELKNAITYLENAYAQQADSKAAYQDWVRENVIGDTGTTEAPAITATSELIKGAAVEASVVSYLRDKVPDLHMLMESGMKLYEAINTLDDNLRAKTIQYMAKAASKIPTSLVSPWGEIGSSSALHDTVLVKSFEANPDMGRKEILVALRDSLMANQDGSTDSSFAWEVFKQVSGLLPKELKVRYVTPDTLSVLEEPVGNSHGWYVADPQTGKAEVYILSTDHLHSAVTPEVVLHELMHAVLAQTVESEIKNPSSTPAGELVRELENLRKVAQNYVDTNNLGDKYKAALSSVHELISWGMNNKEFQDNVLSQLKMSSTTGNNTLVKGMKRFIQAIGAFIFGNKTTKNDQLFGMEVLVRNVAGLFAQVAQTPSAIELAVNQSQAAPDIASYTTLEVYEALSVNHNGSTVDPVFSEHLQSLLKGIVNSLQGMSGTFKDLLAKDRNVTPEQAYIEALTTGQAPFASESVNAGVAFTDQEAFVFDQVEATVRAAIDVETGSTYTAYRELDKLFSEAEKLVKPSDLYNGDWAQATPSEKARAQATHDFIFTITPGVDGRSDHLARFAAMGLTHQGFNALLKQATARVSRDTTGLPFFERLQRFFQSVLEWFSSKATHTTPGQDADAKLTALVQQLVLIESQRRNKLAAPQSFASKATEFADQTMLKRRELVREKLEPLGKLPIFQNNGSNIIKAMGSLVSAYGGRRLSYIMRGFKLFRDQHFQMQQGIVAGLLNEARGANETNAVYHFLIRASKLIEGNRKDLITNTAKVVLEHFDDAGRNLTQDDKVAITKVFLRTDMAALLGRYTMAELSALVNDGVALKKAIDTIEAELTALDQKSKILNYYVNSSLALGYMLAQGKTTNEHVMLNAGNIARLYATGQQQRVSESEAKIAEPLIDALASLYAVRYTDAVQMKQARSVLERENARANTDKGNGVEAILMTHKALQDKSKELLFGDSPALMMKGYTPEIYDPYMAIMVADEDQGKELIAQGYKPGATVALDRHDPDGVVKRIYSLRDGGLKRRVSGVFSLTGMVAKGDRVHSGNVSPKSYTGQLNAATMTAMQAGKRQGINSLFMDRNFDPSAVTETFMAPLLNANGDVVNYRYMMQESTKDDVLNRDNRPDKLLGALAGSIYDKDASPKQNRTAVQALFKQYEAEFAERPAAYMEVGPSSADPELREIYRLLPYSTKEAIKEIWGREGMLVRSDLLDINFGYRKLSIADAFQLEKDERNFMQGMLVQMAEYAFKGKANLRVRQAEDIWQAVIQATKSNLVVKSWSTLTGNLRSNWSQLLLEGISPIAIMKYHKDAFKGAWAYRKDSEELFKLTQQIESGYIAPGNELAAMNKRIAQLNNNIARNPVKPMIDAGLMPTIVEDVAAEEDIYSYKSKMTKNIEKFTDKLNPHVVTAGKWLLMTEDSAPYKVMSFATQISDFLARYTLYQHVTTKSDKPMKHAEAIQLAADAFINYDVPTHRMIQYANDSGLIMFSKYYIRIQKMIGRLYRDHPGRIMMMLAAESWIGAQPTVLDSSVLVRFGNPLNMGALDYPSSISELTTVRLLMAPFKGSGGNPME